MRTASEWAKRLDGFIDWKKLSPMPDMLVLLKVIEDIQADAQAPRPQLTEFQLSDEELGECERTLEEYEEVWRREDELGTLGCEAKMLQNFPFLLSDLAQAKALIEDMQEDGTSDRLAARLAAEYQKGFDEGMEAAQEKWREKMRKQNREDASILSQIPWLKTPLDPDFPDDVYDILSHLEDPGIGPPTD